jgi:hypothetical protein
LWAAATRGAALPVAPVLQKKHVEALLTELHLAIQPALYLVRQRLFGFFSFFPFFQQEY